MIPQSRPDLRSSDFAHVARILATRQIAAGPFAAELERTFARAAGTRYAAAASSGTAALHLALCALKVGAGDEVLVPSYTCPAVAHAVKQTGAVPRFVDVDPRTLNLTAGLARRRIRRRTKAMIVTHTFGFPAPLEELIDLGLPVVEDCSTAVGARYHGRPVGSIGTISICSLYATKVIAAGQGGMVCTSRRALLDRVQALNGPDRPELEPVRYNYGMSDLTAGVALAQVRRLPQLLERRRAIAARYVEALGSAAVRVQQASVETTPIYYRFAVRTDHPTRAIARARRLGIVVDRPVAWPLHRFAGERARDFAGTEDAFRSVVSLPLYPALTEREVETIARVAGDLVA